MDMLLLVLLSLGVIGYYFPMCPNRQWYIIHISPNPANSEYKEDIKGPDSPTQGPTF
jgi:hypothetical protein